MPIYQRVNGVWTLCQRPYVLRNGAWTAVNEAWVRRSGNWVQAYNYDVTPPDPPEIALAVVEDFNTVKGVKTLNTRYVRVGVRLPGVANDPSAKLVRVLTDYEGKPPTTQFGGTKTIAPDANYPDEPWSEWRFGLPGAPGYSGHPDSSVMTYKQWPRNFGPGQIIKSDSTYHFTGWSLDENGNWSAATQASIHIPKAGVDMPNVVTKEARFQPNSSGSWRTAGFASGDLVQQNSPRSQGVWLYGNQFTDSVGSNTTSGETITVKSAQIFVRRNDDGGSAVCNVYVFWMPYGTVGTLPPAGNALDRHEITKVGTLAKGQGAWFDLPPTFANNLSTGIKGIGLDWKDPVKSTAFPEDYSSVVSTAVNLRCGEVHVVWEEEL